jgi:Peptidase family M48
MVFFIGGGLVFAQAPQQNQPAAAPATAPAPAGAADTAVSQILDKVIGREAILAAKMKQLHPLVETYLQDLDKDDDLAFRPVGDKYFLGKLDFLAEDKEHSFMPGKPAPYRFTGKISQLYSVQYLPGGFAQMLVVDGHFDKQNYNFEYVRKEFIGQVRTLVFDVIPRKGSSGTFKGRIWVEDKEYNVVRFNGTYGPSTSTKMYFHFDSWREYMGEGVWLPAYVYTEESDMGYLVGTRHLRFKGQTRLWGYNAGKPNAQNELTALIVESDQVNDKVEDAEGTSPVYALRAWERQAEDNIIQRLEKAALVSPDGEVNKVLETVITNLEVTNNLDIQPDVRARVLLTSPLESFTIGHTIVLSRGLIDVLPDEASLAMILAHELAHIALGHRIDTKYAFNDRMLFEDPQAFQKIYLQRDEKEEVEADNKAAEFLKNSPYKDKLANAGLFLEAVDARARQLPNLLLPHIGNSMVRGSQVQRMISLKQGAPKLEMAKVDQIAALPLGGRVRVDPWSGKTELVKAKPVALLSAREKMPFEVTPFYLNLTRRLDQPAPKTADAGRPTAAPATPDPTSTVTQ